MALLLLSLNLVVSMDVCVINCIGGDLHPRCGRGAAATFALRHCKPKENETHHHEPVAVADRPCQKLMSIASIFGNARQQNLLDFHQLCKQPSRREGRSATCHRNARSIFRCKTADIRVCQHQRNAVPTCCAHKRKYVSGAIIICDV